jgi:hypothetical protein
MSESSSAGTCATSCRNPPFASNRIPSSSVIDSFIYALPSVHERLAYGLLVPEAERVVEMACLVKALERVIDQRQ